MIPAGKTVKISFEISAADLAFCHDDMSVYAEPGDFQVWVAPDAESGEPATFTLK